MKRNLLGVLFLVGILCGFSSGVLAQAPTIAPSAIAPVCAGDNSFLFYSSTNLPTTYSITWSGSPAGLPNVPPGTYLPASPVPVFTLPTLASGVYYGTIIASNGSGSSAPMGISITVTALPVVYTVTGGGNYCLGGPGVHIGVSGSEVGVQYQLYRGGVATGSPVWGLGTPVDFGFQTVAGTYTVKATNAYYGCNRFMAGSVTVGVDPIPVVIPVTGGGGYCDGGVGVNVGLSASVFGTHYQLFRGGMAIGGPLAGIGMALDFGPQSVAGNYTVVAMDSLHPACSTSMSGSRNVYVYPTPTIYSVTGGGSYCDGGYGVNIGLSGSNTGVTYKLYKGLTLIATQPGGGGPIDFGAIIPDGVFRVKATNSVYGCAADMADSAVISLIPVVHPTATVNASIGTTVCAGRVDSFWVVPTFPGPAPDYVWDVNGAFMAYGPTFSYIPSNGDIVHLEMTSNATCAVPTIIHNSTTMVVKDQIVPTVVVNAFPGTNVINGTAVTLTAVLVNKGVDPVYQWHLNGSPIAGATNSTYVTSSSMDLDVYSCKVLGCADSAGMGSITMRILPRVGVAELTNGNGGIQIVPNPGNGLFSISGDFAMSGTNDRVRIRVTDLLGKTVYTDEAIVVSGKINKTIKLSADVAKGMYILSLTAGNENHTTKIVVE